MSFQSAKIVQYLGEDEHGNRKFVLVLPPEEKEYQTPVDCIQVAHDYVRFDGDCSFEMIADKNGEYPYKPKHGASNWIKSHASVTIGSREFFEVVLPYLNSHEYMQANHFADREYDEDDKYWQRNGFDKPRYKKGDKYPAYTYGACVVQMWDKTKGGFVYHTRRVGEKVYDVLTHLLYTQIKDTLKLWLSRHEIKKETK